MRIGESCSRGTTFPTSTCGEFAHSVGPFAKWKGEEIKRANFLRKAVDIIRACALHGFACLVEQALFDKINSQYCPLRMGWYAVRARGKGIASLTPIFWLQKEQRELDVDYIFEAGRC